MKKIEGTKVVRMTGELTATSSIQTPIFEATRVPHIKSLKQSWQKNPNLYPFVRVFSLLGPHKINLC
jgi:hypothetical protein